MGIASDIPPPAPGHRERYGVLDAMRGLAALMVFVQHGLEKSGFQSLESGMVATAWLNLGETGVALFFLISGFIIPASTPAGTTVRAFVTRRVLRIYPLYWTVFAATMLAAALGLVARGQAPFGRVLLAHAAFAAEWMGLPTYVAGSWTLFIEMVWYAAFAAALFSGVGTGVRLLWIFLAAHAAVTVLAALAWPGFPLGRLSIFALCFLGYLYLLRTEGKVAPRTFAALWACFHALILTNLVIRFHFNPSSAFGAPSFQCVIDSWSIALVLFPLLLRRPDGALGSARALRRLGLISYSVYLVHSLVMDVLLGAGLSGVPFLAAAAALTLAASSLTYRLVEVPGIRLARRLTRARRAAAPAVAGIGVGAWARALRGVGRRRAGA